MPQLDHNQEIELHSSYHESTNGYRDTISKIKLKRSGENAVLEKTQTISHALSRHDDVNSKKFTMPIGKLVSFFEENGQQS